MSQVKILILLQIKSLIKISLSRDKQNRLDEKRKSPSNYLV